MATDTLAAFLRARLDEDEAAAKAAEHQDGPQTLDWHRGGSRHLTFSNGYEDYEAVFAGEWDRILIARDSVAGGPLAEYIARHDPARVLREVEAKRAILDAHAPVYPITYPKPSGQPTCDTCQSGGYEWEPEDWPCPTVRALAAVYSDHEGYDPGWKP